MALTFFEMDGKIDVFTMANAEKRNVLASRLIEPIHFHGVAGSAGAVRKDAPQTDPVPSAELLHPLAAYKVTGGRA